MFVSRQRESRVDDPPVPLQRNVPAVPALVELLDGRDELVPVDPANDGREAGHQAHAVLRPRHLHAAHLIVIEVNGIYLCY